jgi:hypothetical protein
VHERARHGDALLLAAGELARAVGQAVGEADAVDQLVEPLLVDLAAGERERQQDVLLGGEDRHEVEGLEDEAEPIAAQPGERLVAEPADLLAVDGHGAARRRVEAREQVHQRGLAGARRAHDGGVLAGRELQGHAPERLHGRLTLAVDAAQVGAGDDRGHGTNMTTGIRRPVRVSTASGWGCPHLFP